MTPERWQQVKELVAEALSVETQERSRLLARVCSTDPALYQEVHQLLALENEADAFLESSPVVELDSKAKTLDSPSVTFQPKAESDSLAIGTTLLEKYTILKMIGQGGMARVYQARHIDLGIFVAVKVLKSAFTQDPSLFERFKREAQTAASLDHPNSVRVFDYGVQGTACYLVMEYLEGESLRQRLKARRRISLDEVLVFLEQVCPALGYVHRKGVIHRDLKPDNIFFAHQDGKEIVKILDFGIAKPSTIAETLTNPDLICGTPHYMSPEQCVGDHITLSSDLYSLGVILYEMLAGVRPFEADATLTVMYAHVNLPVPELSQRCPEIPQSVSNLVARLMSKKQHDRFSSADEFLQAIRSAIQNRELESTQPYLSPAGKLETLPALELKTIPPAPGQTQIVQPVEMAAVLTTARQQPGILSVLAYGLVTVVLGLSVGWVAWFGFQPVAPVTSQLPGVSQPARPERRQPPADLFVLIPGGKVTIGRNADECRGNPDCQISEDETPAHQVNLAPFFLSRYEVTNQEYLEFVQATQTAPPPVWKGSRFPSGQADWPVTDITWEQATAYCVWRAGRDGLPYRLPTEEEWEYAARGTDNRLFSWGNEWNPEFANVAKRPQNQQLPLPVTTQNVDISPFGIVGMTGNVKEWTASSFSVYPGGSYVPTQSDQTCKVIRGGSFKNIPDASRTSFRTWDLPTFQAPNLGFRLAVTNHEISH